MKRLALRIALALVLFAGLVLVWNASWRVAAPDGQTRFIAHRGVHQTFNREGLDNDTCTAERMDAPVHPYLENTLASMQAAFAAGADIVELDVHPTTDGTFAVFHDWTLDCRTEGSGNTRDHAMAALKALDIGYGYTADAGRSFPFRGEGIGLMPSLPEVLGAMPQRRFIVNFKSNDVSEADRLAALIADNPAWSGAVWGAYGGDAPTTRAGALLPELTIWTRQGLIDCLLSYIGYGWTGVMPAACHDTALMVPLNIAPWLWGWPNLFIERFEAAGTTIILTGPFAAGDMGTAGIDTPEALRQVPPGFPGYVWTNKIERIAPLLEANAR